MYALITQILAIVGSVFALYKVVNEFVSSRSLRLLDEFKCIREFIDDLKPDTHPFVIEKWFRTITGDATLTAKEIIYLLSLPFPSLALKEYSISRKYVELKESTLNDKVVIVFRKKYTHGKRKFVKFMSFINYIVFATLAFVPITFAKEIFRSNWQSGVVAILMSMLSFGPLAISSMLEYIRVRKGEELVALCVD